ncbi:hypothetical protein [Kitasatospora purpeofusca]|uniref:hypothetical protein n=1 Tax=Kitasatospora purpeofusca TaxID=67352 RepID=UPI003865F3D0|nr:hypothetical protein OIP63_39175 [Kitasatospora purpeofusca]
MSTTASAAGRARLLAVLTLLLTLTGLGGQAFAADPAQPHFTATVDDTTLTAGQIGTLSVTFTNRQDQPVTFLYATVNSVDVNASWPGVRHEFVGCAGGASWCSALPDSASFNLTYPQVPVLPGESRTVAFDYRFTAGSDCTTGAQFGFSVQYFYYEYGASTHQSSQDLTPPTVVTLVCPTAA